jgi:ATP-dependent Clp protease ATP-binding subunit ClpA
MSTTDGQDEAGAFAAAKARLGPYARRAVDDATALALHMHADELTVEHLFSSLLADEESGAAQAVLHAFADPETLSIELMAMSPGITVVGAARCVPFSVRGVAALRAAHAAADPVEPRHLLAAAFAELDAEAADGLRAAGARPPELAGGAARAGPLFQTFSTAAKRAASQAAHEALRLERAAISPAHLLLGALEVDEDLRAASGLTPSRARARLAGADHDPTPPAVRAVPPTDALLAFLRGADAGADSLALLAHLLDAGSDELVQLFTRQKVTSAAVARARAGFGDPDA